LHIKNTVPHDKENLFWWANEKIPPGEVLFEKFMKVFDNRHVPIARSGECTRDCNRYYQGSMTTKDFNEFLIKEIEENALWTVHILPKHKERRKGSSGMITLIL